MKVSPLSKCLSKPGLMRKWGQGVNVGEVVVDQKDDEFEGRDGLCRQVQWRRGRVFIWRWGQGRRRGRHGVGLVGGLSKLLALDGFSVAVWRPSSAAGSVERAWNVQSKTCLARRARFVTLGTSDVVSWRQ